MAKIHDKHLELENSVKISSIAYFSHGYLFLSKNK